MAITITNLGASSGGSASAPDFDDGVDRSSYSTASWTPPTSGLILLWVYNTRTTSLGSAPTVSGNGITWLALGSDGVDSGSQTHRCTLFAAKAGGSSAGQTTVSFAGDTQSSCIACFVHVIGADVTGTTLNSIQQTTTNNANGVTSLTVTLATATSTANRFFCGIGHGEPETHTPESGWTAIDEVYGTTPGHGLLTMWHASSTSDKTPTVSWTTSRGAAGVACEVKELASAETNTIANTVGITDSLIKEASFIRTLTNSVGITDARSKIVGFVRTLTNSVGITDSILVQFVSGVQNWVISISDTVNITDSMNRAMTYIRKLTNSVGITSLVIGEIEHFGHEFLSGIRSLYVSLKGKRDKNDDDLSGYTG